MKCGTLRGGAGLLVTVVVDDEMVVARKISWNANESEYVSDEQWAM